MRSIRVLRASLWAALVILSVAPLRAESWDAGEDCQAEPVSACAPDSGWARCDCGSGSNWYGQADALFLNRVNRAINQPVVLDLPGATVLSTGDISFPVAAGPRLIFGFASDACHDWEAVYFGLHHWNGTATATDPANLRIPGDLGLASINFIFADQMQLDYASQLHNFEINRWTHRGDWSWLLGFRYVNLDETFNIHTVNTFAGESDYHIQSYNHLFGGQVGGRRAGQCGRFGWDVTGKAGLFANAAGQSQWVTDFPPGFPLRPLPGDPDPKGSTTSAAFVGDLSFSASYRLTRVWALRGGYNLIWVEGVALAPDQLDFTFTSTSGSGVFHDGGVFLHGAHVGLEARW